MISTSEHMEFRLLGALEVVAGERLIEIGSAQQRALLAMLALHRGAVVSGDALVAALWGDSPPPSAPATLRSLVARLRRTLAVVGDAPVRGKDSGYVLEAGPDQVDAERFARLIQEARQSLADRRADEAAEALRAGLDLWRGPALGELAEWDFARLHVHRLEEARLGAVEDLAEAELTLGRPAEALARLETLVGAHPLRERAWGQLMLALYRLGRQAEALRAYQRVRSLLGEELGIEPNPTLRDLQVRILQQDPELGAAGLAQSEGRQKPRDLDAQRHNLPVALTSFVGRGKEVGAVDSLLSSSRLVTLTGVGGAGKTRLALQVAAGIDEGFPDGVWLVELGPIRDPGLVVSEAVTALGLRPSSLASTGVPLLDALCEHLRRRRLLLILDNCEHLIEAAADLAHALLARCPDVLVLATSREVLGIPGEVVFRVPPLSLPAPTITTPEELARFEAIALFCERAAAAEAGFGLTAANAEPVARICRRLDGIPLALELAAARMRMLGAHQVAARLDDTMSLLSGGMRTVVARHQTLRAAIDWSYQLLPNGEQTVLRRLSVFPGSFDLEAAEAVVGDVGGVGPVGPGFEVLDLLTRLVDKSLLVVLHEGQDSRYRLLETIREYAALLLIAFDETTAIRRRHRDFFLTLADEGLHRAWVRFEQIQWLRTVDAEQDNFRAALEWSMAQGDSAAVLRLTAPLWQYWLVYGIVEGCEWLERAWATPGSSAVPARVEVAIGLGELRNDAGHDDGPSWIELLEGALTLALATDEHDAAARVRVRLSEAQLQVGKVGEAERLIREAMEHYEATGSRSGVGMCLLYLSWVTIGRGDLAGALEDLGRALELGRRAKDDFLLVHVLAQLALVCALSDEAERAECLGEEAVATSRRLPGRQFLVMTLIRAAEAAALSGRADRGRGLLAELLGVLRDLGTRRWVAEAFEMAAIVIAPTSAGPAATLLGAAQALRQALHEPFSAAGVLSAQVEGCRAHATSTLEPEELEEHERTGRAMATDEAIVYALVQLGSGQCSSPDRSGPVRLTQV